MPFLGISKNMYGYILTFLGLLFKIQNNLNKKVKKEVTCILENNFSYSYGNIAFPYLFVGIKTWKSIIIKKRSYDISRNQQYSKIIFKTYKKNMGMLHSQK